MSLRNCYLIVGLALSIAAECFAEPTVAPSTAASNDQALSEGKEIETTIKVGDCIFEVLTRSEPNALFDSHRLQVKNGEKIVFKSVDYVAEVYLTTADENIVVGYKPSRSKRSPGETWDFDGDGKAEVLVDLYTGGQGCCQIMDIFKVTPEYKLLGEVHSDGMYLKTERINGRPSLQVADGTFYGWMDTCSADSPSLMVWLQYDGSKFVAVASAIEVSNPGPLTLPEYPVADAFAGAGNAPSRYYPSQKEKPWVNVPVEFWRPVVVLLYVGETQRAWAFFDENWPTDKPGKKEFRRALMERLQKSPYWSALKELNHF